MIQTEHTCSKCGKPLDNPLAKARGQHRDCGDGEVIK